MQGEALLAPGTPRSPVQGGRIAPQGVDGAVVGSGAGLCSAPCPDGGPGVQQSSAPAFFCSSKIPGVLFWCLESQVSLKNLPVEHCWKAQL